MRWRASVDMVGDATGGRRAGQHAVVTQGARMCVEFARWGVVRRRAVLGATAAGARSWSYGGH